MDVVDLLPDAVVMVEEGPTVTWVNRAAEILLGSPRAELIGRPCADVLPLRNAEGRSVCELAPLGQRMPIAKGMPESDFELHRPDSASIPVTMRCTYDKDEGHVVRRIVCALRDARASRGMDMRTVELISTVSHEIRSPLTSIKGFTKTLLDRWDRFDDDLKKEMLTAVNTDADRVTRLLGELLDISRLEAGRLGLRLKQFDLGELAGDVVSRLAGISDRHTVETELGDDLTVVADPDKIQQVLTNLVENALKYTDGGRVQVRATRDGRWVSVGVSDEGEGIPQRHVQRLFRKFYRRDRAGSPSGTGLGLYICRGLIEAHGGAIVVDSEPGRGSTFSFRIPVAPEVT